MGSYLSSAPNPTEEIEEEDVVENEHHVEIGDQNAVKNMLDDTIVEFFRDQNVYTIHYGWDNIKLLLMVSAAAIAAISHFYTTPALTQRMLILICVIGFFTIHTMLLAYSMFIEKDILLRLSKKPGDRMILVKTTFPLTEDHYNIVIEYGTDQPCAIQQKCYVGKYFDAEGYFDEENFVKQIASTLSQFEKQKTT